MVAKKEPENDSEEATNGLSFDSDTLVVKNFGGDGSTSRGNVGGAGFPPKKGA